MTAIGVDISDYDPQCFREIPDGTDFKCFAPECRDRAEFAAMTPFGYGVFCPPHCQQVLTVIPAGPAYTGHLEPAGQWLPGVLRGHPDPEPMELSR